MVDCWPAVLERHLQPEMLDPLPFSFSLKKGRELELWCAVLSCSVMSDAFRPHGLQPTRLLCPWLFSRQEYWSGVPCLPVGDLPNPGFEPRSPALQADSFLSEPPGKPESFLEVEIILTLYLQSILICALGHNSLLMTI